MDPLCRRTDFTVRCIKDLTNWVEQPTFPQNRGQKKLLVCRNRTRSSQVHVKISIFRRSGTAYIRFLTLLTHKKQFLNVKNKSFLIHGWIRHVYTSRSCLRTSHVIKEFGKILTPAQKGIYMICSPIVRLCDNKCPKYFLMTQRWWCRKSPMNNYLLFARSARLMDLNESHEVPSPPR